MISYSAQELKKILPHRYPFLLIDRIEDVVPGERALARKNVTINEPFFQGHFPDEPVMPGVLIVEAMAQSSVALFIAQAEEDGQDVDEVMGYLGALNKVKFRRKVVPGDTLMIEIELIKQKRNVAILKGVAKVDGEVACQAELTVVIATSEADV